jgi:hypothetical protein
VEWLGGMTGALNFSGIAGRLKLHVEVWVGLLRCVHGPGFHAFGTAFTFETTGSPRRIVGNDPPVYMRENSY